MYGTDMLTGGLRQSQNHYARSLGRKLFLNAQRSQHVRDSEEARKHRIEYASQLHREQLARQMNALGRPPDKLSCLSTIVDSTDLSRMPSSLIKPKPDPMLPRTRQRAKKQRAPQAPQAPQIGSSSERVLPTLTEKSSTPPATASLLPRESQPTPQLSPEVLARVQSRLDQERNRGQRKHPPRMSPGEVGMLLIHGYDEKNSNEAAGDTKGCSWPPIARTRVPPRSRSTSNAPNILFLHTDPELDVSAMSDIATENQERMSSVSTRMSHGFKQEIKRVFQRQLEAGKM
eukprot:NODE_2765_length_1124_cov_27.990698_g2539_i0.p1 GENE.NODE_2765_length_1124_cov_27.990698_g2539_i0~~NODE_2765_length_1124_cov_27.990698_g2539_i0.p1  ORF type:complete len:288 (+),score=16.84 NODE_2765_length_1124_cov_27.990698_g2539_i0:80-943(+)